MISTLLDAFDTSKLLVAGTCVLLGLLWWVCFCQRPAGLPPGPGFALPVVGHLLQLERDPRAQFHQWRRQYGDVFSLYLGDRLVVVFCGMQVIREALLKNGEAFSDRPWMVMVDKIVQDGGVVSTSGEVWKEQRRTSLEILHNLGLGKNVLAVKIKEEVANFVVALEGLKSEATDVKRVTTISVSNNICSILFGQRFCYDDPLFTKYLEFAEDNAKRLGSVAVVNYIPFLGSLPGDPFEVQKILDNVKAIKEFFLQPLIDRHKLRPLKEGDEAGDFVHAYLHKMRKEAQESPDNSLNEFQLLITLADLFIAGTETTAIALLWALLFLLHYPRVQDKCYAEICRVVGPDRLPDINDRAKLIYLEATINEVLRLGNINPLAVEHAPNCDVSLHDPVSQRDYDIPKGTIVLPFLETVLQDPEVWGDPQRFRPERFVNEGKLVRRKELIPFGIGRRACLGEPLARMELFLYLSTLIQHFRFLPEDPDHLPSLEGILGATYCPAPFRVKAERRG